MANDPLTKRVAALEAGLVAETNARTAADVALAARISEVDSTPDPVPPIPPHNEIPTYTRIGTIDLRPTAYARGPFAIDFAKKVIYLSGHAQRTELYTFPMPEESQWRAGVAVAPTGVMPFPYDGTSWLYPNGMAVWNDDLKVAPRMFYDMAPPPVTMVHSALARVDSIQVDLPRQRFAGFGKTWKTENAKPALLLGGGYESGQGSAFGICAGTWDGKKLLEYDLKPEFESRQPREPNYSAAADSWVAQNPRVVDGKLKGVWACDIVSGGGVVVGDCIDVWPTMGTGPLDYANQTPTFAANGAVETHRYRLRSDASGVTLVGWEKWSVGRMVRGQEVDGAGRVYLSTTDPWYGTGITIEVYEVA